MNASLGVGAVLHWKDFEFSSGTTKDKLFVVLGAKTGHNILVVIATSKPRSRDFQTGCNAEAGYYHIPGGSKDYFIKDTWLLLMECYELSYSEVVKAGLDGVLTVVSELRQDVANAIRNCLKQIEDVSPAQLELL